MIAESDITRIVSDSFDISRGMEWLKDTLGNKPYITKMDAEDFFKKGAVKSWIVSGDVKVERTKTNRLVISTDSLIRAYASERLKSKTKVRVADKIK